MKKFYDDPLAAAIMARDFGVEILVENEKYQPDNGESPVKFTRGWRDILDYWIGGEINPDSYHILEPKDGDLISIEGPDAEYVYEKDGKMYVMCYENMHSQEYHVSTSNNVIQRDGKPFFTPSEEADDSNR